MITSGIIASPFAKNDSLVRHGKVISDLYFYGESPAVYPSPLGNGTGDWADAYARARALVTELTLDEKVTCSESCWFQQS